ncbi:MAG: hypothetical protein A2Y62_06355 [Candidatus Fischerbacteria bacterium RBG_13_37_8]|uniref:HD domain-containing protein n=1 Tax=Candidatus Fischerbacteria bacterium RBG_13_37_8 TaxID=1817863 RepID=A0A1F5VH05_9BACT|nr:MAG: hypothetical protein A2Y62_06355 [Candidatus Fischerbacteria bacterium RBG_13_37_8]
MMQIHNTIYNTLVAVTNSVQYANTKGYLIGGTLRDLLLNKSPADLDFLVEQNCHKTLNHLCKQLHAHYFAIKKTMKLYRLLSGKYTIDFAELKNESLEENLSKRDFTINSIAFPLSQLQKTLNPQHLIDPFNGYGDLKNKIIKHTSASAFSFDPVRILRAFRLQQQLQFTIHPDTLQLASSCAELLTKSPAERILLEFVKILSYRLSYKTITAIDTYHILDSIFPEIKYAKGCLQLGEHHLDVWQHCLLSYENLEHILNSLHNLFPGYSKLINSYLASPISFSINTRTALKIACLFHDIGKPPTKILHKNGTHYSFIDHQKIGAIIMQKRCKELRFDKKTTAFISFMIKHHLFLSHYHEKNLLAPKYMNRYFMRFGEDAIALGLMFLADKSAHKGNEIYQSANDFLSHYMTYYFASFHKIKEKMHILDGYEIMHKFQLPPGPFIGKLLKLIQEAQLNGKIHSMEDCFRLIETEIKSSQFKSPDQKN